MQSNETQTCLPLTIKIALYILFEYVLSKSRSYNIIQPLNSVVANTCTSIISIKNY